MTPKFGFSPEILGRLSENREFFDSTGHALKEEKPGWKLRGSDPQAYFTVLPSDGMEEITLAFPVDDDAEVENGRLWIYDRFIYDKKTRDLHAYERQWQADPAIEEVLKEEHDSFAKNLNRRPPPSREEATAFLNDLLPDLRQQVKIEAEAQKQNLLKGSGGKKDGPNFSSPWLQGPWKSRKELKQQQVIGALQAEDILKTLGGEVSEKHAAAKKGWLRQMLPWFFKSDAPELDKWHQEARAIGANPNPEQRALEFLRFGRDLAIRHDLMATPFFIGEKHKDFPGEAGSEARRLRHLTMGNGGMGTMAEYLIPRFVGDLLSPSLLAMVVAPFAGAAAETHILGWLSGGKNLAGRLIPRILSEAGELAAESLAFVGAHHALRSATLDPNLVWKNVWGDTAAAILNFGLLRLAHAGAGMPSQIWADSRFNRWAVTQNPTWKHWVSPLGRIDLQPYFGSEFNWKGKAVSEFLHHIAGIAAFKVAAQVLQNLPFQEKHPQRNMEDLFDSVLLYLHALIGFNLANKISYGQLQTELAEVRMRTLLPPNAGMNAGGIGYPRENEDAMTVQGPDNPAPLNPAQHPGGWLGRPPPGAIALPAAGPVLLPPLYPVPPPAGPRPPRAPEHARVGPFAPNGALDPLVEQLERKIQDLMEEIRNLDHRGHNLEIEVERMRDERDKMIEEHEKAKMVFRVEFENKNQQLMEKDTQIQNQQAQLAREVGRAAALQKRLKELGEK